MPSALPAEVIPALLVVLAVLLVWVAPRSMSRRTRWRWAPRAALVAWQAVTLAGILAVLAIVPATVPVLSAPGDPFRRFVIMAVAVLASGLLATRLLVVAHRSGTRLRVARADHRELVDIVARLEGESLRVLEHSMPTAYCIPGSHARVVLSQGVLDTLSPDEVDAVLAHEAAHLRERHDLLLEFFNVVHESVPRVLRSDAALAEVRLLIEMVADRSAAKASGAVATAGALMTIAESRAPEMAFGTWSTAQARMELLAARPQPTLAAIAYGYAAVALVVPVALFALAWHL